MEIKAGELITMNRKKLSPNPSQETTPEREARTTGQWICTELYLQCSGLQFFEGDWLCQDT